MTERRFYQVRQKHGGSAVFGTVDGLRTPAPLLENRDPMRESATRAEVFVVTERRRVAWDPTYSRVEEAP